MKLTEHFNELDGVTVQMELIEKLELAYDNTLPDEVKKIISLCNSRETIFYSDKSILRSLSSSEILNATEDLEVDFIGYSIIPLFDIGENDFLVYDFTANCWCLFNIVDEIKFRESSNIFTSLGI